MRSVTAPNVGRDWPELNASLKRRACIAGKEFKPGTVKAARQAAVIEKREEKLAGVLARRAARVAKSFPYPTAKAKKAAGVAERRAARAAMVERKTARAA
jgi:hypothetical protein